MVATSNLRSGNNTKEIHCKVLLEKLIVIHLVIFPTFMETFGSLTCFTKSATGPYPNLSHMNPVRIIIFFKTNFSIILSSTPRPTTWSLPSRSDVPTKILYTFRIFHVRTACPSQLIFLDLIIPKIFGEEYEV